MSTTPSSMLSWVSATDPRAPPGGGPPRSRACHVPRWTRVKTRRRRAVARTDATHHRAEGAASRATANADPPDPPPVCRYRPHQPGVAQQIRTALTPARGAPPLRRLRPGEPEQRRPGPSQPRREPLQVDAQTRPPRRPRPRRRVARDQRRRTPKGAPHRSRERTESTDLRDSGASAGSRIAPDLRPRDRAPTVGVDGLHRQLQPRHPDGGPARVEPGSCARPHAGPERGEERLEPITGPALL